MPYIATGLRPSNLLALSWRDFQPATLNLAHSASSSPAPSADDGGSTAGNPARPGPRMAKPGTCAAMPELGGTRCEAEAMPDTRPARQPWPGGGPADRLGCNAAGRRVSAVVPRRWSPRPCGVMHAHLAAQTGRTRNPGGLVSTGGEVLADLSILEEYGLYVSGESPDGLLVEAVELSRHPWFVAVQFHPEFQSKPTAAHPLFREFIHAAKVQHAGAGPAA
jgi:hypothetical protein